MFALTLCLPRHDIDVVRLSFAQLYDRASLSPSRQLLISPSSSNASDEMSDKKLIEISVVYFRAGYAPTDYTDLSCWDTRLLLERSAAIKCPSVQLQLAGAKKVQQVLASSRGALERYANTQHRENELSQRDLQGLRETFTGLYPLDDTPEGQQAEKMARDQPERFVLKPQREGGGNNIYRHDIPPFLTALEAEDTKRAKTSSVGFPKAKEGYILMDIISPPQGLQNLLVRASDMKPKLGQVVSELGIYGVCLFRDTGEGGADSAELLENYPAGHLLRTKGRESDEGGVSRSALRCSCLANALFHVNVGRRGFQCHRQPFTGLNRVAYQIQSLYCTTMNAPWKQMSRSHIILTTLQTQQHVSIVRKLEAKSPLDPQRYPLQALIPPY